MSACDPLIQAERRFKARCLNRSRWDLFPCRGPVVPCRTLSLVSATCNGTVKPWFARPTASGDDTSTQKVAQRLSIPPCYGLRVRLRAILAHRVATHLNAVGVVNEAVEDAVGQRGIADLFVPARDRQLRGQDLAQDLL